jgi:hypothetical protein
MIVTAHINGISAKLDVRADGVRGVSKFRAAVLAAATSNARRKTAAKKLDRVINGLRK